MESAAKAYLLNCKSLALDGWNEKNRTLRGAKTVSAEWWVEGFSPPRMTIVFGLQCRE